MSSASNEPDLEELLADLLAGELRPNGEELRRLYDAHPGLEAAYLRELSTARRAQEALDFEESVLRELQAEGEAADVDVDVAELERQLMELAGESPMSSSRFPWPALLGALAAGLVATLLLVKPWGESGSGGGLPEGVMLGTEIDLLESKRTAPGTLELTWEARAPVGGYYELRLYQGTEAQGETVMRKRELTAPTVVLQSPGGAPWSMPLCVVIRAFEGTGGRHVLEGKHVLDL